MPALEGQFLKEISVRFAGENPLRTQKNTKQSSAQRFLNDPFPKTPFFIICTVSLPFFPRKPCISGHSPYRFSIVVANLSPRAESTLRTFFCTGGSGRATTRLLRRVLRRVLKTAFEKVLRRVLRRRCAVGFRGGRVLRRVLRRGSKKGLSRRHIEGGNTPF